MWFGKTEWFLLKEGVDEYGLLTTTCSIPGTSEGKLGTHKPVLKEGKEIT